MIKLESKDYAKAIEPLGHVRINTLFAEAVIQKVIPGNVYVDDIISPRTFYIAHPFGMSLLFGEPADDLFRRELTDYITNKNKHRHHPEWLQIDPTSRWNEIIDAMASITRNTRVNFSFNRELYFNQKEQFHNPDLKAVRVGQGQFRAGTASVDPKFFWRDEEHFLAEGVGFTILEAGEIASTAFSAFCNHEQLEIGIESHEAYRGRGYAYSVCSALIDYCLSHQLEPVWACRLDNKGSYHLAQRLGFEPSILIPYYRLENYVYEKGN